LAPLMLTRDPGLLAAAAAAAQLGLLCREGRGGALPPSERGAPFWFRQAAERGHAEACFNLGLLLAQGRGGGGGAAEANFWFERAAALGRAQAGGANLATDSRRPDYQLRLQGAAEPHRASAIVQRTHSAHAATAENCSVLKLVFSKSSLKRPEAHQEPGLSGFKATSM
jgi:TPR repeat protein